MNSYMILYGVARVVRIEGGELTLTRAALVMFSLELFLCRAGTQCDVCAAGVDKIKMHGSIHEHMHMNVFFICIL